jgi:sucrose-6-phosphate hydrolase SacC (GH32 family)
MLTLSNPALLPAIQHPDRHVWDFWYHFDAATGIFHLFYLNADRDLVPGEQHHFASQVGYATTRDFQTIEWIDDRVLAADPQGWDNTSIWSGDIIQIENGFLMFYTSRDGNIDDGMTQNIGVAYSPNVFSFDRWFRLPELQIKPQTPYELERNPQDLTIAAWRDPFLFRHHHETYMLLSAKSPEQEVGKKGSVALLRAKDMYFENWEYLPPICNPGFYAEMEVPQVYESPFGGYELVYSAWAKYDFAPTTDRHGGLQGISSNNPFNFSNPKPSIWLPESSSLYACRVIPELNNGEIVGFDTRTGGIRRSNVQTGLKHLNRNFKDYTILH